MQSIIKHISLYKLFPRANRKYLPVNNQCKAIAAPPHRGGGLILTSTVNYPKFTVIIRHMVPEGAFTFIFYVRWFINFRFLD